MRTPLLATVLTLGLSGMALADARVLMVQDSTSPSVESPQAAPAEAQPSPPAPATSAPEAHGPAQLTATGRFRFEKSGTGYVRLDTESGQVALCAPGGSGWTCDAVPEDRAALEKDLARQREEIGRLQDEIASLKRDVAALRDPPPPRPPADLAPPPPGKDGDLTIKLPTQEEIDRATAALQRAWDLVVDMIGNLTKDLSRKPHPDRTTL